MSHLAGLAAAALDATRERAAHRAKSTLRAGVLFGVAGVMFLFALGYGSLAIHGALSDAFSPVVAGASVGIGFATIGVLLAIIAALAVKRPKKPVPAVPSSDAALEALLKDVGDKGGLAVPVAALALGVFMSRR